LSIFKLKKQILFKNVKNKNKKISTCLNNKSNQAAKGINLTVAIRVFNFKALISVRVRAREG
jgi:hypothetical protein